MGIRVRAENSIGLSDFQYAPLTVSLATKPGSPENVKLQTAVVQDTPITSIDVSWEAPTADGGAAVEEYVVEWWQEKRVPEVQLVRFFQADPTVLRYPNLTTFSLRLSTSPTEQQATDQLAYNILPVNFRSEVMGIGFESEDFSIGDVEVTRSAFPGKGYEWTVTFMSADNDGNIPEFFGAPLDSSEGRVDVIEQTPGSRVGGSSEKQVLSVSTDKCDVTKLTGFFRLSFNGTSVFSPWLSVGASSADVAQALAQLPTLRAVSVTQADILMDADNCGASQKDARQWTVVFDGDIGDQPALYADYYLDDTSATDETITVRVFDGDNSLDGVGKKLSLAAPGETPYGYNRRVVSVSTLQYSIDNLVAGESYTVSVSARNAFGVGFKAQQANSASATPPKQIPLAPSNVRTTVNGGSDSTLLIRYDAPASDGGSDVSDQFTNPIASTIHCPSSNIHTVFEISAQGTSGDPISSGYFSLTMKVAGQTQTTDAIAYDVPAMYADEVGLLVGVGVTVTATNGSALLNVTGNADVTKLLFANNRIKLPNQLSDRHVYVVQDVQYTAQSFIRLDRPILLPASSLTLTNEPVKRYLGGRGSVRDESRVTCTATLASSNFCPTSRVRNSGSIQSKLELLGLTSEGLKVERDSLVSETNGNIWRVTFLDDSPENPLDFSLEVAANEVYTASGAKATVQTIQRADGQVYPTCTGEHVVPEDLALQMGQTYSARVFALNEIGYGPAAMAPERMKPMVVPTAPTSVVLTAVSRNSLRVTFNPPSSSGGDEVRSYKIEYSTTATFTADTTTAVPAYLGGGAPYSKTLSQLDMGVYYYVRVSAVNLQGVGAPAISTPDRLNPHEPPAGPSNVKLFATSNSMLTVSFEEPEYKGGDSVTHFKIEWDPSSSFTSASIPMPHKGSAEVPVSHKSFTITLLDTRSYYVRVSAKNGAGYSAPTLAFPTQVTPMLQVPGKPHTVQALTGDNTGEISVSWQRPRIPYHGFPCSGSATSPEDCPAEFGEVLPSSFGGTAITEYLVSWNEKADFTGFDSGTKTTTTTNILLTGLTSRRTYYIRVLARNAQGSGQFCSHTDTNCNIVSTSTLVNQVAK